MRLLVWTAVIAGLLGAILVALQLALILAAPAFGYQSLVIRSESMAPTLLPGDRVLVRAFGGDQRAQPGAIVVFDDPARRSRYAKRVFAVGGQTIGMLGDTPSIDGAAVGRAPDGTDQVPFVPFAPFGRLPRCSAPVALGEPCARRRIRETLPNGAQYPILATNDEGPPIAEARVPAGHLFLLGDHRSNSLDSRLPAGVGGIGMLPEDHVFGTVTRITHSVIAGGGIPSLRWDRFWKPVE